MKKILVYWGSEIRIISRPCTFHAVNLSNLHGFWLVLLMGHIICCVEAKKEIVNQHYNGAYGEPYESIRS